jgi:hypothetical protein
LLFQFKERPACWVRVLRDGRILMDSKSWVWSLSTIISQRPM